MAEILLSLTIIGVVAAITLPSLTGNINERTWNTQRKALYARFSQAIALMPALNGYGTLKEGEDGSIEDTAAETFVTDGLAKVLKINNICDSEHLEDCGIPKIFTNLSGGNISSFPETLTDFNNMFNGSFVENSGYVYKYSQINTKAAAFETVNGESIVVYYNPKCVNSLNETAWHYTQPKMCANFVYDLNGSKGPNTVGKDIGFITVLYPSDPVVVAPLPVMIGNVDTATQANAGKICKNNSNDESRLPNREELAAMFYNRSLLFSDNSSIPSGNFWSSSVISAGENGKGWSQNFIVGSADPHTRSGKDAVWCVKR